MSKRRLRIKSGIVLRKVGAMEYDAEAARDEAMEKKVRDGYFCWTWDRDWPERRYCLAWYAARHRHHRLCGGTLEAVHLNSRLCCDRALEITEAEAYRKIAALLAMGYTVSFAYENGSLEVETFFIRAWRRIW